MDSTLTLDTATGTELELPLAGAGSRAFAYIIDWHIRAALVFAWVVLWMAPDWSFDFSSIDESQASYLWLIIPPSLLYLLYHPLLELLMQGDSPGKRMVGVRCVDLQGDAPTSGAILLRNIMRFVDSLPALYTVGTIAIIVSHRHQRLGDMVAGTLMVVAGQKSEQTLARLERIGNAPLEPQEAELVVDLLDRWKTLSVAKRRSFAESVLGRRSIAAAGNQRQLKKQLEALLSS